jgi:hypothetical protein
MDGDAIFLKDLGGGLRQPLLLVKEIQMVTTVSSILQEMEVVRGMEKRMVSGKMS